MMLCGILLNDILLNETETREGYSLNKKLMPNHLEILSHPWIEKRLLNFSVWRWSFEIEEEHFLKGRFLSENVTAGKKSLSYERWDCKPFPIQ